MTRPIHPFGVPADSGVPLREACMKFALDRDLVDEYIRACPAFVTQKQVDDGEVELLSLQRLRCEQNLGEFLITRLHRSELIASGSIAGSLGRVDAPADWWLGGVSLDLYRSSVESNGTRLHAVLVREAPNVIKHQAARAKLGRPSVKHLTMATYESLLAGLPEGQKNFSSTKAAYRAVLKELNVEEATRGYSYNAFVDHLRERLAGRPD